MAPLGWNNVTGLCRKHMMLQSGRRQSAAKSAALAALPNMVCMVEGCDVELSRKSGRPARCRRCNEKRSNALVGARRAKARETAPRCSVEGCASIIFPNNTHGFCRPHAIMTRRRMYGNDVESARRARMRNQFVEFVYRSVVWERDHGVCHICTEPADSTDWHLDHIIPLSKGGLHSYANTAVSHPHCNHVKSSKILTA